MKTFLFISLLTSLVITTASVGADSGSSSPTTPSVPQPYTDGGTTTHYVPTTTTNYYSGSYRDRMPYHTYPEINSYTSSITYQHRPIYYPPTPPALGESSFLKRPRVTLAKFAPPSALAQYVYEPFYSPLSTLLFTEDLSKKRRERLDQYRASRASLLTELRARLETLQNSDPTARETSLAALAREQAPGLAALEATAEELRRNFVDGGFFESTSSWKDSRQWRLGDDTRWESALDEIKVARDVAAFQDGLSPAQRRLVREIAMELSDGMKNPIEEISLSSPGPFIYFSPETARIRLPAGLPEEILAKIDTYKSEKAELKKELHDIFYRADRFWLDRSRTNAFKTLAESQAPRFAHVEQLAEEIRRDLVPFPNPALPPALPLPGPLASRLQEYNKKKAALQTMLIARQDEVKNALPEDRVEFTRVRDAIVLGVVANRRSTPTQNAKRQAILTELAPFNQQQIKVYSELAREKETIRLELSKIAMDLSGKKSLDQLLREFTSALKKQEDWDLFHDYATAVLEPGLSPQQRVLLFGNALEKFDLPLSN